MTSHRVVNFTPAQRPAPAFFDNEVALVLPKDAREALVAASRTEPHAFRARAIARAALRIKTQYPQFFL